MKFQFHSIRQKLLGIVLLTTLVALFVSIGTIVAYDLRAYHKNLVADMTTQADLLGHMTAAAITFDDHRLAAENLGLLKTRAKVRAAAIYDAKGVLFATYAAPGALAEFPKIPDVDDVRVERNSAGFRLILFKRIVNEGTILGTVYLRSDYELVSRGMDYFGIAFAVMIIAMFIAYLVMARLERVVTHPIYAISRTAREVVEQQGYSRRVEKTSDDEIGVLTESFNDMLAEIERRTQALENSNREIAREVEEKSRVQQEIMRLNSELEMRVHERTVQLETINEELVAAKEIAENANQAKSAFLSSMSHELRTPLNAILGFAQLLVSDTLPSTPEQKKAFGSQILKAGRHLLTLINEILDLAKIESGTLTLSVEPVALEEIMQECQTMTEPLGQQRSIRTIFPKKIDFNVLADRTRLKQVMLNLLSNAIKYNRDMGTVVVGCTQSGPGYVRISVQDTGEGLDSKQLEGLFQPFNRLGQEAGAEEGTGIGLVVTKRLVELMGGAIGVTSTVGIGSVFWIELKATLPSPSVVGSHAGKAIIKLEQDGEQGKSLMKTVLYVEDNPANLKLVEEIIHLRADLHLLSAPDGHLGIELACAHVPQVILMDINLPGMSGFEALKILQASPKTAHIPVIALTANAMPREVEKGVDAGFFRYITKPINIDEFTDAVNRALEISTSRHQQSGTK